MAINEITGDTLQTKASSESYRTNYDAIFRKKVTKEVNSYDEKSSTDGTTESGLVEHPSDCSEQR
jgi:hypothetical protein